MAGWAFRSRHIVQQEFPVSVGCGFVDRPLEISKNPAESGLPVLPRLSVEQKSLDLFRKLFERDSEVKSVRGSGNLQLMNQILGSGPGAQTAFQQRLGPIVDHSRRIEFVAAAQSVALLAGAVGAVEGKRARLKLRHAYPTVRAGQPR